MPDLILRTCNEDGTSHGGFQWPLEVGVTVEAPDWDPSPVCGGGLHGLLKGEGDVSLLDLNSSVWVAFEAIGEVINLDGKVKCKAAIVRCVGGREVVCQFVKDRHPEAAVPYCTATAGDYGTATAGYGGTATAGDEGTATAGNYGTATTGYYGTATAGDYGTATAGDYGTATTGYGGTATTGYGGTATAGDEGTATAGDYGTATTGYGGTATAGDEGTATAGNYGTATAGDGGTATTGYGGTATAGESGIIQIAYFNGRGQKRIKTGYIGSEGLKPDTKYKLDNYRFVEA